MDSFTYTPDPDHKVHVPGALKLICAPFQSHEDGLPEWAKNSADEYARSDAPTAARDVVIIFQDRRGDRPPTISCLDFGGMSADTILKHFRHWASPEASRKTKRGGVQGGHGNGGKCYMTQMFEEHSYIFTVLGSRGSRYGVPGNEIKFGFIPDSGRGKSFRVDDVRTTLREALEEIGCPFAAIDAIIGDRASKASGFTLTVGVRPKGYVRKIRSKALIESLRNHSQMVRTLELCNVYVVVNGEPANGGIALSPPPIAPIPGAKDPRVVTIPGRVKDPQTGQRVSTTNDGAFPEGRLMLFTSQKRMRWSLKGRHNIRFEALGEMIGFVPVPELGVDSPYRDQIYGECQLDSLAQFKQNQRAALAESPLTRGIRNFIAAKVEEYCGEFERQDRRSHDQKERDEISRINEALDQWKNQFLNEVVGKHWGMGGVGPPPPPPPLPSGVPERLELRVNQGRMGRGVATRPHLRFFDRDGRRIRSVPVRWSSDDNNVALPDEDLGIITTFAAGVATIHAEVRENGLRSNAVAVEVVEVERIRVEPPEITLQVGGRGGFTARCGLRDGTEATDVQLIWTEANPDVARVSAGGTVFGVGKGETEVTVGDDYLLAENAGTVVVHPGKQGGEGDGRGRGFPRVLVSGEIDADPDTGDYVYLGRDHPPVYQRVRDVERNIWWINSEAPLARLFLSVDHGYGYDTREWRVYHLERFMDIIVQIAIEYLAEGDMAAAEWTQQWGEELAKIQGAVASDLAEFIQTGAVPVGE